MFVIDLREHRILDRPVAAEEHPVMRLLVCQVHGPGDLGILRGELLDSFALLVEGIDAEARRLSLDTAGRIFESVERLRRVTRGFRPDEIFIRAVTDAGD